MSATPRAAGIEIWFDFASNYSYLSIMRIEAEATKRGVAVIWKPFLLGPIFQSLGWNNSPFVLQKLKGDYVWKDMARQCRKYGLPEWKTPSRFPRSALLPLRLALLGGGQAWIGEFCRRIATLNFVDDVDVDDADVVSSVLIEMGLPAETLIADAQSEAGKLALRAQTEAAQALGIFGAPTFVVGDEIFWGNDRLEDALDHCGER